MDYIKNLFNKCINLGFCNQDIQIILGLFLYSYFMIKYIVFYILNRLLYNISSIIDHMYSHFLIVQTIRHISH